jgi:hypothetical protein
VYKVQAAVWRPILHTWFRGPWGASVRNVRPWEWPVSTRAASAKALLK